MTIFAPIKQPDRFYIDGEWRAPSSDAQISVIHSGTEELFVKVAEAQAADMNAAVAAAREAFDNGPWPRMSHKERAGYLNAIADEVRARTEDFKQVWSTESGAVKAMVDAWTPALGGVYNYYAGLADTFPFFERHAPTIGGNVGFLVREPVGVSAAIVPWNAPLINVAFKCAPGLLAGCTLILKASPQAPGAAYLFAEICEKVGLPRGVLNVVMADREVSELLVKNPDVDKVTFTGSTRAGRRIASILGDRIGRFVLELGGKSAGVVLDDYDVEVAAKSIAASALPINGQACASLTRIVVTRARHDALLEALGAAYGAIRVGDAFDANSQMGPLGHREHRDRVEGYIAKGKAEGATLATGGGRPAHLDRGWFVEPTVFGNVDNNDTIAREEIFGPVITVIPANDEADAVRIANDTIYGLNASVFTNDVDRAFDVSRQLRSGTVGHNAFRSDFGIAFGGFKQSGVGREGGVEGLLSYLEAKTVIMDAEPSVLRGV